MMPRAIGRAKNKGVFGTKEYRNKLYSNTGGMPNVKLKE
jgi:hypothetical protein